MGTPPGIVPASAPVNWDQLTYISEAGKEELRGAGLNPATALHLQTLGYTSPGDLELLPESSHEALFGDLAPIQAAKLKQLLLAASHGPADAASRPMPAHMQAMLAPKLLPQEVFDRVKASPSWPGGTKVQQLLNDIGGIGGAVKLLSGSSLEAAKEQAAWALRSVAAGTETQADAIVAAGAVAPLVALLSSGTADAKEQAAGALGNLAAAGSGTHCDAIVAAGAVAPLVALLSSGTTNANEPASRALWNLADCSGSRKYVIMAAGAAGPLMTLLRDGTADAKEQAAAALQTLAAGSDTRKQALLTLVGVDAPLVASLLNNQIVGTKRKQGAV